MTAPDSAEKRQFPTIGAIVLRFQNPNSTNDVALGLAAEGLPEGAIICAKTQTHGKGRRGRKWFSPVGGLYFSVVLRPRLPVAAISLLSIGAGISVARAIRRLFNLRVTLKWPNDVIMDERKIGGVMTQSSMTTERSLSILGFGVNVNNSCRSIPSELCSYATSIVDHVGSVVKTEPIMKKILDEFAEVYSRIVVGDRLTVVKWWKELTDILGQPVTFQEGNACFEGVAVDLTLDGALLVQLRGGMMRRLLSEDVTIRRNK